jgi:uncharacterized protein (TIGR02996 family)
MHAAFIQAIRDEPGDDTPRLVFADYLEDQGQADRAELIRVQCELTRGPRDRGRSLELRRRLRALVAEHRDAWLAGLAVWARDAFFERGFVEHLALPAATFLEHAAAILAAHPVHSVQLRGAAGVIHALAGHPGLAQLRSLDLHDNSLRDRGTAALAASPHLHRLTALLLPDNGVGRAGAQALARAPLDALETLLLSGNALGDEGALALACSPHLARLTRLDLSSCRLTDAGAAVLAGTPVLARLTSLRLAYNNLTSNGAEVLAGSPRLARLTTLDLVGNAGIDRRAAAALHRRFGPRLVV